MRIESVARTWARRSVTIPVYAGLAVTALALSPAWALLTPCIDVVSGQGVRLPRTRTLVFFTIYLWCEVAGILIAGLVWGRTLGGRLGGAATYRQRNAAIQRWWTSALFKGALTAFSMRVEVEGLEHAQQGPYILLVRHTSSADTVLAAALVANPNRILLRYVLKRELLWDPCLDIVGQRLPNAFVDRKAPRLTGEVQAVARLAVELDEHAAVLIYPEGTRFSPAKLLRGVADLRAKGLEDLADVARGYRMVLPPRIAGPMALLDAAPSVDVVLLEHCGFEGASTFARLFRGELVRKTLRLRVRRIAAADIPPAGRPRERWLFDVWAETDRWVSGIMGAS